MGWCNVHCQKEGIEFSFFDGENLAFDVWAIVDFILTFDTCLVMQEKFHLGFWRFILTEDTYILLKDARPIILSRLINAVHIRNILHDGEKNPSEIM